MIKVKLRNKSIMGGQKSLYLDFYPPILHPDTQKQTRREHLKLYIYDKAKTPLEKNHNNEVLSLAENIRAKRQIAINQGYYGFLLENKKDGDFIEFFAELLNKKGEKNKGNWLCTLFYLKEFSGKAIGFKDITIKYCNGFKDYLLKAYRIKSKKRIISQNTAQSYFNTFKTALRQAYKDGILKNDISIQLERIKSIPGERPFLTKEELNKLINIDCGYPLLKEAALFSALTGLRYSDVRKLLWSEVHESKDDANNEQYTLHFTQKKTKGFEVLPISKQAYTLLGVKGESTERVFEGLKYSAFINHHLKRWILEAGISKKISFHCFRHTYATLQLSAGTDLYTVSKMLGHRSIKTTQIYAKVVDKSKREATNKIILDFSAV